MYLFAQSASFHACPLRQNSTDHALSLLRVTGQICSSTSRILIQQAAAAAFYKRLKQRAQEIAYGDPLQPGCRLGPLVNEAQYKRVCGYVQVNVPLETSNLEQK